jgi:predicted acyl esterase
VIAEEYGSGEEACGHSIGSGIRYIIGLKGLVQAGYVIVAQDTRRRYASEGEFTPFLHEAEDGADTIAWAASQPWSTGKVGMFGVSYQGLTRWQAASEQPAAWEAIASAQSPKGALYPYQGGTFLLTLDAYWRTLVPEELYERIAVPALTIAGWYDFFQREDLEH